MEMKEVESSAISKIGYDPKLKLLAVEYKSGATYVYNNVPSDTYVELVTAPSIGSYMHYNVANAYTYTKVLED